MICWHRWRWSPVEVRRFLVQYWWEGVKIGDKEQEDQRWQQATCQKCGMVKSRRVA